MLIPKKVVRKIMSTDLYIEFALQFLWYDIWIGAYWDRDNKKLYVCPLPMVVFSFKFWTQERMEERNK